MPTSPQTLDPQAVSLAKAIRQTESGGDFTAKGKSGEHGAYQFTQPTFEKLATKYGVQAKFGQATPEQQNELAYKQVKEWKDKGYNPGQIASMWNAGEGEPDAYTGKFSNGKPATGTNKYGAKYDVPAYAKSVATAYQTLKQGGQVNADPQNPSSTANKTPLQDPNAAETYGSSFPSSKSDSPVVAGAKSLGNVPSSLLNLGKGLLGAAAHPIKTIEGVGSGLIGAGENIAQKVLGGKSEPDKFQKTANAIGKAFMDRYGSLENAQRTATNDPAGFGADVLTAVVGGQGLLKGAASVADTAIGTDRAGVAASNATNFPKTGLNVMPETGMLKGAVDKGIGAINSAVEGVAEPIASGVKSIASAPTKMAGLTLGQSTGAGYDALKTGLNASSEGGDATKAFTEGLRGNASPEELVSQAKTALQQVKDTRRVTYQDMLKGIEKDTTNYDISPVIKALDKGLDEFNIGKNADGSLDFSRSNIRFNKAAQTDIQTIVDEMKSFGTKAGDRTAIGIDNLKQAFYDLDRPSSSVRGFTTSVAKATRNVLEEAPGYTRAMKEYADMSEKIDEIRKGLSLGDTTMVDTSFRKLMSAIQSNNPVRQQLVRELDEATGGQLLPKIAGTKLSGLMPMGLSKYADIGGGLALHAAGTGIMPLLGLAITTSPRVVGEFVKALGLGIQVSNYIMNLLNKASVPSTVGAGLLNSTYQNSSTPQ